MTDQEQVVEEVASTELLRCPVCGRELTVPRGASAFCQGVRSRTVRRCSGGPGESCDFVYNQGDASGCPHHPWSADILVDHLREHNSQMRPVEFIAFDAVVRAMTGGGL